MMLPTFISFIKKMYIGITFIADTFKTYVIYFINSIDTFRWLIPRN